MSRIEVAPEVREDLERILEHLNEFDVAEPSVRINEIIHAISVLEHNPLIGRPVGNDLRELILGRGAHGYIALYRYLSEIDTVFLLAIRSQREAGYRRL
jgi:plasmid stabilization system protein ParE